MADRALGAEKRVGLTASATPSLRRWCGDRRARGTLGVEGPPLFERVAQALDAADGSWLRRVGLHADRIVVERIDGTWVWKPPFAHPDELCDGQAVQSRFATLLRQCLERELDRDASGAAASRLDVVLRRAEHESAAARYGSCEELARAVAVELAAAPQGHPARAPGLLAVTESWPRIPDVRRRRTRWGVLAACIVAIALLAVSGAASARRRTVAMNEGVVNDVRWENAEPAPTVRRDGGAASQERDDPGVAPALAAVPEATETARDGRPAELAELLEPAGTAGSPGEPQVASADVPPDEGAADRGQPGEDGTAAPPPVDADGRPGMPGSVTIASGASVSPADLLVPCATADAAGRRLPSAPYATFIALGAESGEGGGWRQIAFRSGFKEGACEFREPGIIHVTWITRDEDIDGETRIIRACGQLVARREGGFLRDGVWMSWDETGRVLTVAEYDRGSCRRVTVYRDGVEEARPRTESSLDELGSSSGCSCVAFNGIDAVVESVSKSRTCTTSAIQACRRETAEAESRRQAVVRFRGILEERAAQRQAQAMAEAVMLARLQASFMPVCYPSRDQLIASSPGSGGGGGGGWGGWAPSYAGPPPTLPMSVVPAPYSGGSVPPPAPPRTIQP